MSGDIDIVSEVVARSLGYRELKRQQRIVINSFVSGNDVFAPAYTVN